MKRKDPKTNRPVDVTERKGWSRQKRGEKKSVQIVWAIRTNRKPKGGSKA